MKKLLILLLLSVLPVVFWSCSDDDDDNPVNPTVKNYFPLYVGSNWVYEKYDLDSNNQRNTISLKIDSAYCSSMTQEQINGTTQNVYTLKHISSGVIDPDQKFYVSNGQIYQNYQFIPGLNFSAFGIDVNDYLTIDWLLLIDQNNQNWTSLPQKTLEIPSINVPGVGDISLTLNLELKGMSVGNGTFTIGNGTVDTKDYELDWKISGTVKIDVGGFPVPLPLPEFTLKTVYKLANDIGIVSIKTNSQKVSVGNLPPMWFVGSEQNLIRYHIAQP